jgi:acyl carrier protein
MQRESGVEMQDVSVRNRILSIVTGILAQNEITADLHPESRLVDLGLNSIDMVAVMLRLEAEFDFTIPQPQITPENFQSIKTLELMILSQLGARSDEAVRSLDCSLELQLRSSQTVGTTSDANFGIDGALAKNGF